MISILLIKLCSLIIIMQDTVHSVVFGTLSAVWSGVFVVLVVLWWEEGQTFLSFISTDLFYAAIALLISMMVRKFRHSHSIILLC